MSSDGLIGDIGGISQLTELPELLERLASSPADKFADLSEVAEALETLKGKIQELAAGDGLPSAHVREEIQRRLDRLDNTLTPLIHGVANRDYAAIRDAEIDTFRLSAELSRLRLS